MKQQLQKYKLWRYVVVPLVVPVPIKNCTAFIKLIIQRHTGQMLSQTQVIAGVQVQHTTANNYVAIDLNPSIAKRNLQATHPLQVPSAQQRHSQHCPSPNSGVLFYHAAPWTGLYELELGGWSGPALSSEAVAGKSPSGWRMTRQTMTSTDINGMLCLFMKTIQLSLWQRHQQWYHKETQGGKVKVSSKLFKLTWDKISFQGF